VPGDPPLPPEELEEVFGDDLVDPAHVVVEQLYEPVVSASMGIWRVRAGRRSAVLKLIAHSEAGHVNWRSGEEATHWYYWRREVFAYESGLLGDLPGGLRAPRCYFAAPRPDGSVALWLEDLGGVPGTRWAVEHYGLAARHLGQTQGAYLVSRALPDQIWLSRGWLRAYLSQRDGDHHLLDDASAWRHDRIAAWFPSPPIDRARAMRHDQPVFLAALERLPRTLSHLDLHPANLFADGDYSTAAIDWSFVGLGAIGEDAGNLVPDSVLDFHVAADRIDDLYETVATGYTAGLRDAGWDGPDSLVRLGMAATMAAKYSWILPAILRAAIEHRDQVNGRPFDEAMQWWAPAVRFLLDRAGEARDLAAAP
jgi:hypothetical protein